MLMDMTESTVQPFSTISMRCGSLSGKKKKKKRKDNNKKKTGAAQIVAVRIENRQAASLPARECHDKLPIPKIPVIDMAWPK